MENKNTDPILNHPDYIAICDVMGTGKVEEIVRRLIVDDLRLRQELRQLKGYKQ